MRKRRKTRKSETVTESNYRRLPLPAPSPVSASPPRLWGCGGGGSGWRRRVAVATVHRKSCAEHTGAASPLARARCDHQATEDCPPPCGHSRGLRPTRPAAADEVTCDLVGGLDYDRGSSPARRPWRAKLPHTQVACRNPWMQSRQMGTDASVGPAALQPRDLEEGLQSSCPHLQTGLGGVTGGEAERAAEMR